MLPAVPPPPKVVVKPKPCAFEPPTGGFDDPPGFGVLGGRMFPFAAFPSTANGFVAFRPGLTAGLPLLVADNGLDLVKAEADDYLTNLDVLPPELVFLFIVCKN